MGRKGPGAEVRDNSIRLQFTFNGEVLRRTLNVEGKPLPPTASNLRHARMQHPGTKRSRLLDPRYDEPWYEKRAFRRSYWEPTLRRLGMRYRPPYNTRHTYATMMLMAGMTPAFCAKQLRHSV